MLNIKHKSGKRNNNHMVPGERRELNPRMVDSQSTALIHLATSAPLYNRSYGRS
uniref:ribosomal protein S19 n=1 Tax=Hesperocnide tenella TaxID=194267 RepID=UPI0020C935DE|nr:ribosomal protein S19 [Hesperocnide tenella]USG52696.1 ribosomal protein S19 [Hesperocnide tenella]